MKIDLPDGRQEIEVPPDHVENSIEGQNWKIYSPLWEGGKGFPVVCKEADEIRVVWVRGRREYVGRVRKASTRSLTVLLDGYESVYTFDLENGQDHEGNPVNWIYVALTTLEDAILRGASHQEVKSASATKEWTGALFKLLAQEIVSTAGDDDGVLVGEEAQDARLPTTMKCASEPWIVVHSGAADDVRTCVVTRDQVILEGVGSASLSELAAIEARPPAAVLRLRDGRIWGVLGAGGAFVRLVGALAALAGAAPKMSRDDANAIGDATRKIQRRAEVLAELLTGMPAEQRMPSGIAPKREEKCLFREDTIEVYQLERWTEYVGGHAGLSYRIAKNLTLRMGVSRGVPVDCHEYEPLGRCLVAVTDWRVLIFATERTIEFAHDRYRSELFSDGVLLIPQGERARPLILRCEDPSLAGLVMDYCQKSYNA